MIDFPGRTHTGDISSRLPHSINGLILPKTAQILILGIFSGIDTHKDPLKRSEHPKF